MKIFNQILILILFTSVTYAQKVMVAGNVHDTFDNHRQIQIVLNDTLNKFSKSDRNKNDYGKILRNKELVVKPNENGNFQINAKLSDSVFFTSLSHLTQKFLVSDLIEQEKIVIELEREPCIEFEECNQNEKILYVFIGKKIKLDPIENINYCDRISMDAKFKAEYRILENLYGNFSKDTIKFDVYDHYGTPSFSDLETVILYVFKNCEDLIHLKYQFNSVYLDANDEWIVPYPTWIKDLSKTDSIQMKKVAVKKDIEFDFSERSSEWIDENFPLPYYKRSGNKVKVIYGISVENMFEIMKKTSLRSRGYFK